MIDEGWGTEMRIIWFSVVAVRSVENYVCVSHVFPPFLFQEKAG